MITLERETSLFILVLTVDINNADKGKDTSFVDINSTTVKTKDFKK